LEETTMGVLRARLITRLREADRFNRLRIVYPVVPGLGEGRVIVHAKVLIVDDVLARVGSANLNNRSMGMDTECDVSFEALGDETHKAGIARFRNRLLGEHLGASADEIAQVIRERGSLVSCVEWGQSRERSLQRIELEIPDWLDAVVPCDTIVDPEQAVDVEALVERVAPDDLKKVHRRKPWLILAAAAVLLLAITWRWTPIGERIDPDALARAVAPIAHTPAAPFLVIAGFVLGSFILVPVTAMIAATAVVFEPWGAIAYSIAGVLAAAVATYMLGWVLGRDMVRRLMGRRLTQLSRGLARRGLLAMVTVRLLPIAPFPFVNMAAGVLQVRFRDFVLGTLLGMVPGIVALSIFAGQVRRTLRDPLSADLVIAAVVVTAIAALIWVYLRRHGGARPPRAPRQARLPGWKPSEPQPQNLR
jgi:uncharacterized membrane protein YdjX (TVP38/TMEM64 family)